MSNRSIAPRYAKVLFELDRTAGDLESRLGDFESLCKVVEMHPGLVRLLSSPLMGLDAKKELLQNCLKGRFDHTFMNFIFLLIEKGRFAGLMHIADEYRLLVNRFLGIWEADIVTAVPMAAVSESRLKQKLERVFDKKIKINKKVDPQIVGGAILVIENEMLDWSVTGRLRKLRDSLIATQV